MKNRVFCIFCVILFLLISPLQAFATGNGNVNGGGGGLGTGTSTNKWIPGDDGVRVTVVKSSDNTPVIQPIDYTNIKPASNIMSFGAFSKLDYRNGRNLTVQSIKYTYQRPVKTMPRIITSASKTASIAEIKKYFCSEYMAKTIAIDTGLNYSDFISGEYKLLLEPIAYFLFNGINVGMTATEAALYDMKLGGGLRAAFVSLTHKNLPLAMFLERADMGFPAWSGSLSGVVSNEQTRTSLGLGIVWYVAQPPELTIESVDYEYRTDTEVISAITLSSQTRLTPDNPASVSFKIMGSTYTVNNIVIPEGESQIVWCKWKTPSTPQEIIISVTCNGGSSSQSTIKAKIVDLNENIPPNPKATDRNDSFVIPAIPTKAKQESATWTVWSCYWLSNWEKCEHSDDDGDWHHWIDNGNWEFTNNQYSSKLTTTAQTKPDEKAITATNKKMKSGYGVNILIRTQVSSNAPNYHTTGAQNAISYFPEFNYDKYWRLHDRISSGYNASLELKNNPYSTYNKRVHFTPVYYPNGNYTTYTYVLDSWTPAGMLSTYVTDSVSIEKSVFDDWHVAPKK